LSGIAVPESFENGLRKLGAKVEVIARFADHHRFHGPELKQFVERCVRRDVHCMVTTEKDYVRFPKLAVATSPSTSCGWRSRSFADATSSTRWCAHRRATPRARRGAAGGFHGGFVMSTDTPAITEVRVRKVSRRRLHGSQRCHRA
jgi:hypothetical protein